MSSRESLREKHPFPSSSKVKRHASSSVVSTWVPGRSGWVSAQPGTGFASGPATEVHPTIPGSLTPFLCGSEAWKEEALVRGSLCVPSAVGWGETPRVVVSEPWSPCISRLLQVTCGGRLSQICPTRLGLWACCFFSSSDQTQILDLKEKVSSSRKLNFLELGCTFCMVFRKPVSTAPHAVGGELGHVSREAPALSCSAFPCGPGPSPLSLKSRRGLPSSGFRIHPVRAAWRASPGRTPGHLVAAQLFWNSRLLGHLHRLESPRSGSQETATHASLAVVWCGGAHLPAAPFSCVQLDSSFGSAREINYGDLWKRLLAAVSWGTQR